MENVMGKTHKLRKEKFGCFSVFYIFFGLCCIDFYLHVRSCLMLYACVVGLRRCDKNKNICSKE